MASFLQKEGIAFYIVNWNFENSAVVVWLQECALWCSNPQEESFYNIFLFWVRLLEVHNDKRKNWEMIRLKMVFYNVINSNKEKPTVFDWLTLIFEGLELKETLLDSDVYPNEISNLDKLIKEAELYNLKNSTINRFAHLGIPNNEVTLTTRHSSKGLEFEAVILLGMEEEHFPSYYHLGNPVALAEDQRLCYVCISRAKNSCILLRSKFFTINTRRGPWHKPYNASRYWIDLHKKFGNQNNTFTDKTYR
ncbi:MAG: 3'-5' exonuclease [Draconibacterium sp.]